MAKNMPPEAPGCPRMQKAGRDKGSGARPLAKMRQMKQRKQKTERQKTISLLDALWSYRVRAVSKICPCCKVRAVKHTHHIFSRRHMNTRWDLENGIGLCGCCHRFVAHQDPETFRDFIIQRKGDGEYHRLKIRAGIIRKPDYKLWELYLTGEKMGANKEER